METQTCRGTTCIHSMHYALSGAKLLHQERILKNFCGIEHLFEMYVDTDQIRLIHDAISLVDAKTFSISSREDSQQNKNGESCRIYGAFACGVNVYLNAHKDDDFNYCATSIYMRMPIKNPRELWHFFAFLNIGIAIPLHPGDIIFFNPTEEQCISSRCCNNDDIYCMSLYLKSDNIGLNNNSTLLTPTEDIFLFWIF